jgi:pimeloyl-ACP methyl ester carboxylesterase
MESRRDFPRSSTGMLAGSATTSSAAAADKAPIVLIHGAGYDSGSWNKVVPLLKAAGHVVVAPDMPGFGTNGAPNPDTGLDDYVGAVISAVNSVPGRVMLVGHSLGGILISQAAERVPDKLASLTYVCAFMLRDGESRMDVAPQDPDSTASKHRISAGEGLVTFTREGLVDSFCNDCSPQDIEFVLERMKPQPVKPLRTALRLTAGNYGRIRRYYIKCTLDRVVTPPFQDKMIAAQPVEHSLELEASHSPFLSKPRELAAILQEIGSSN